MYRGLTVEILLFKLSDLKPTLPTPLKPVSLPFLLSDLIVTSTGGSNNQGSTVLTLW